MKACRDFRSALRALLDAELALERTLELEQHARECRACGLELERGRALERALLALPPAPIERLDLQRNVQAVLARLDAPAPSARLRPRLLRFAPWAAAAGIAALLGLRFLQPAPEPAPPRPPAPAALAQAPAAEPELDSARLEAARSEICAALRECEPAFDPAQDDARPFAEAVDARTSELARSGWPRPALVQSAATDGDAALAARALRWLGVRDQSAGRVRAALARTELAPSAVAALLDLGASGIEELRRVPESAALRELVLQQSARAAQPLLAPWYEDALARDRVTPEERARLLDGLVACAAEGLPALLRLASRGALETDEALARLGQIPGADAALGACLGDARSSGVDERVLLRAVAEVGTQGGWEWVEREVRSGRHEEEALRALARGTPEALAALLRLRAASGAPAVLLEETLERVLREHPESAAVLAQTGSRTERVQLFELAGAAAAPALVPAFVELAASEVLPEPDRRFALQLAAEQGRPEDLAALAALFPRLRERTLQAACLIALHTLGGPRAVGEALERRTPALRRRVLALLEDPACANRSATTQARLARAIENTLPEPQS